MDADKPGINATFASVFTDKISWAFESRDRIQGREDLPAGEEDQVRDILRNFDPYKSMGLDREHPGHKELADIVRPLSIVTEGLWRL